MLGLGKKKNDNRNLSPADGWAFCDRFLCFEAKRAIFKNLHQY